MAANQVGSKHDFGEVQECEQVCGKVFTQIQFILIDYINVKFTRILSTYDNLVFLEFSLFL